MNIKKVGNFEVCFNLNRLISMNVTELITLLVYLRKEDNWC